MHNIYLVISSMRFYGCYEKNILPANLTADRCVGNPETPDASIPTDYRHFAVDDLRDILYVCDVHPTRQGAPMFCFSSDFYVYETPTWLGTGSCSV